MEKAVLGARILLGLIFTVFGINLWLGFLPPPELNEAAMSFFGALAASYLLTFVKVTEVVGGLMLLAGVCVPFALTILAPIVINILFFHIFLDLAGLPVALFVTALEVFLAWAYRGSFAGVLEMKAKPTL